MKKLKVHLENCYGIKKLQTEFDFIKKQTFVIYAPNGVMKTSFAKTFRVLSEDKEKPHDQLDLKLESIYKLNVDDSDEQLSYEKISVIEPYNEKALKSEDKILTLLADEATRNEYLKISNELDIKKKSILGPLKKISGSSNYESEIVEAFKDLGKNNIFEIIEEISLDIKKSKDNFKFAYNDVFDPKNVVKDFLKENILLFEAYFEKYNLLISTSDFFKKGEDKTFGTIEAKNLADSLDGDDYFSAEHKLFLRNKKDPISKQSELKLVIDSEIERVFNDDALKSIFKEVESKLKNDTLKKFKKSIEEEPDILVRIINYDLFKKEIWYSYLKQIEKSLDDLILLYKEKKPFIDKIISKISSDEYKNNWQESIAEFNNRFLYLPFRLTIDNKIDSILNLKTPSISFHFHDKPVEKKKLLEEVLSQGEKRAFYILNVIFEIKSRQTQNRETLFIIDDIADSFDYKNKYAIVEYLNDISQNNNFYSIILTHNFDFYRTISSRLNIPRRNKLHAIRTEKEVKIIEEVYQNPPFITWANNMKSGSLYNNEQAKKHIIGLIPFVRNLIEYGGKKEFISIQNSDTDFNILTSLLHSKEKTKKITFGDIKYIFKNHINKDNFDSSINDTDIVYDAIIDLVNNINDEEFNLENKVILAIAIRHIAENYMLSKISTNKEFEENQTRELFKLYKSECADEENYKNVLTILESVNIMTPENIHLNSFMYEPILDMGIDELKNLYSEVNNKLIIN